MTAHIRNAYLQHPADGYVTEWEVDPILAIGGDYHGEVLPVARGPALMVPERSNLATWLVEPPPEITMPGVLRYERKKIMTAARPNRARMVFPVYVLAGFSEDEAIVWVELAAAWSRLLVMVDRFGCLLSRLPGGIWRRRLPMRLAEEGGR